MRSFANVIKCARRRSTCSNFGTNSCNFLGSGLRVGGLKSKAACATPKSRIGG